VQRALVCGLAGLTLTAGAGCFYEGGPRYSADRFTYVSRAWAPKTVTLQDTRTGETLWTVEVPVGQQLVVGFKEGSGPNEYKPDEMVWALMDAGRRGGQLENRVAAPPRDVRRLDVSLRPAPENPPLPEELGPDASSAAAAGDSAEAHDAEPPLPAIYATDPAWDRIARTDAASETSTDQPTDDAADADPDVAGVIMGVDEPIDGDDAPTR
jgi:hypothetical protein